MGRHGTVRVYVDIATFTAHIAGAPKGVHVRPPLTLDRMREKNQTIIGTGSDAENANLATLKSWIDGFNAKDWKNLSALYASDAVVAQNHVAVGQRGTKEIDRLFKELGTAFPDAKEETVTMWAAGDYVVMETVFTGTNKAAAPGIGIRKAANKPVSLRTAHVLHFDDGKIEQHWIYANGMSMMTQLGLFKAPPANPAADAPRK
jgi:steroid delta-isomerase-like uncharacterized protein